MHNIKFTQNKDFVLKLKLQFKVYNYYLLAVFTVESSSRWTAESLLHIHSHTHTHTPVGGPQRATTPSGTRKTPHYTKAPFAGEQSTDTR